MSSSIIKEGILRSEAGEQWTKSCVATLPAEGEASGANSIQSARSAEREHQHTVLLPPWTQRRLQQVRENWCRKCSKHVNNVFALFVSLIVASNI